LIIEKLIEWLFIEMHYWKMHVCRVPACLPCAKYRAHSKHIFCRVPREKLTAKKSHTTNGAFALCFGIEHTAKNEAHDKRQKIVCPTSEHTAKKHTRQKVSTAAGG